ncbi:hypothetical protein D918_10082 [Trichuris suis]|nr:hypothetical protein D918_10082 [Trichuris suis]
MEFLGFRVTKHGVHPTEEKLKAIKLAPPPKDVKQLQAFLEGNRVGAAPPPFGRALKGTLAMEDERAGGV